jgi:hypothetical protein
MNSELQKKLYEKYPKIFAQKNQSMKVTAMCWGMECGDGWYWLIDNLCKQLQWDIDKNGQEQLEAVQVKEKYGSLRFYTDHSSDTQEAMITLAEALSNEICETCGSTANIIQTEGWIKTLCTDCYEQTKNRGL